VGATVVDALNDLLLCYEIALLTYLLTKGSGTVTFPCIALIAIHVLIAVQTCKAWLLFSTLVIIILAIPVRFLRVRSCDTSIIRNSDKTWSSKSCAESFSFAFVGIVYPSSL
jgi:hypothetical protein